MEITMFVDASGSGRLAYDLFLDGEPIVPSNWADTAEYPSFIQWSNSVNDWSRQNPQLCETMKCALIIRKLEGHAADFATNFSIEAVRRGGKLGGVHHGPVAYVLHVLALRYARLPADHPPAPRPPEEFDDEESEEETAWRGITQAPRLSVA